MSKNSETKHKSTKSVLELLSIPTEVIRWFVCKVPGGRRNNQFARSSKRYETHSRFHKHKIEPKHVYIRLEILSGTYLSVKSIQMDIFRQQIL